MHAVFFSTLALIGSSLERLATELRHCSAPRCWGGRAVQPRAEGVFGDAAQAQPGSWKCLRSGPALRGYALAALENVPLWHRDISHSSVERVIGRTRPAPSDFMFAAPDLYPR